MTAAQRGDLEVVRELVKRGADPNLKAYDGQTISEGAKTVRFFDWHRIRESERNLNQLAGGR